MTDPSRPPRDVFKMFAAALAALEKEVEVPIVPGELNAWCTAVREKLSALREERRHCLKVHDELYEQILETDLGLAHRVRGLRERDAGLRDELGTIEERLDQLLRADAGNPRASWEPDREAAGLREDILKWIVDSRAVEKEIETWLLEALFRDRGGGD